MIYILLVISVIINIGLLISFGKLYGVIHINKAEEDDEEKYFAGMEFWVGAKDIKEKRYILLKVEDHTNS